MLKGQPPRIHPEETDDEIEGEEDDGDDCQDIYAAVEKVVRTEVVVVIEGVELHVRCRNGPQCPFQVLMDVAEFVEWEILCPLCFGDEAVQHVD